MPPSADLRERLRALEEGMYRTPEHSGVAVRGLLAEAQATGDTWAQGFALVLLSGCAFTWATRARPSRWPTKGWPWPAGWAPWTWNAA
ncbi:hypothetical protein [Deinococcus multiflagellatus]|uniref:Uncharacterized protein n=1 Tax=Deinococcus multiflagellatus TaxID=1656887 RepID=A0ABW1ZGD9_9DEIO